MGPLGVEYSEPSGRCAPNPERANERASHKPKRNAPNVRQKQRAHQATATDPAEEIAGIDRPRAGRVAIEQDFGRPELKAESGEGRDYS